MSADLGRLFGRVLAGFAALFALMVVVGLLVTRELHRVFLLSSEDAINRELARERTNAANMATGVASWVANTATIIVVMVVAAVIFRLVFKRWRESVFLIVVVSGQALVFALTTLAISRPRPDVTRLDVSPPTSSFPSGHTGAATALYVGIAVVIALHLARPRHRLLRPWLVAPLVLVPVAVAFARLYRGMHHPSDVAGAYLNGGLSIVIGARLLLHAVLPERVAQLLDGATTETTIVSPTSKTVLT